MNVPLVSEDERASIRGAVTAEVQNDQPHMAPAAMMPIIAHRTAKRIEALEADRTASAAAEPSERVATRRQAAADRLLAALQSDRDDPIKAALADPDLGAQERMTATLIEGVRRLDRRCDGLVSRCKDAESAHRELLKVVAGFEKGMKIMGDAVAHVEKTSGKVATKHNGLADDFAALKRSVSAADVEGLAQQLAEEREAMSKVVSDVRHSVERYSIESARQTTDPDLVRHVLITDPTGKAHRVSIAGLIRALDSFRAAGSPDLPA